MNIALANTLYAPHQVGGAERVVQSLAEGLQRRGHRVSVMTLGNAGHERDALNGVSVHRLPLDNWYWPYSGAPGNAAQRAVWHLRDFDNAAMAARVGQVLEQIRPDVLSTHGLAGFSVAIWREAARRGVPVVHTLHDYYLMCPPSAMYRNGANCERICARCRPFAAHRRRASRAVRDVIGVSRFILDRHLHAGFFGARATARVAFNSIPAAPQAARAVAQRPTVFGFIGRICPEKGIGWLLEEFTRTAGRGERLIVAGRGEPRFVAALRTKFASPSVSFIGQVPPAAFYEQVDVVVVPSLWHEPFGRTAIEPLAYGLPVIASRRGGLPEIVEDGVGGLIVDPDEPGALARALRRFASTPELAQRIGHRGARGLPRFSEDRMLDTYEDAMAGRRSLAA